MVLSFIDQVLHQPCPLHSDLVQNLDLLPSPRIAPEPSKSRVGPSPQMRMAASLCGAPSRQTHPTFPLAMCGHEACMEQRTVLRWTSTTRFVGAL